MSRVLFDSEPEADFLPEDDFESLSDEQKAAVVAMHDGHHGVLAAKQYLTRTDWYVARKSETGAEIPEDVLAKRAQARIDASE